MSRETSQAVEGVVTSDVAGSTQMYRRRPFLVGGAVVLIFALGVGGWLLVMRMSQPAVSTTSNVDISKLSPSEAIATAQTEVSTAHTSSEKQAAYTTLGNAYTMAGQASQSAAAYQQALTYSPNDLILLEMLSDSYDSAGDTADAIKTLNKLIPAINTANPPDKTWLLSRYQAELKHDTGDY